MSKKPLVSGIITFLNAEKFLQEAVESVFAQTYDYWELLLVDDGSTDGSTVVAKTYAENYPEKVRYLEHEGHTNQGISASRNLGIRNAEGEYLALLDADDIWLPQKLETQVSILDQYPEVAMVYSSTWMWYGWSGGSEQSRRNRGRLLGVKPDTLVKPPALIPLFLRSIAETPGTCSVLIRKEIINSIGEFEETFRGMYDDQVFFYKLCLKAPVFAQGGVFDKYRQHPASCCAVAFATEEFVLFDSNPAEFKFLCWLSEYLANQEIKNPKVWHALKRALWRYQYPGVYRWLRVIQRPLERLRWKVLIYLEGRNKH